MPEANPFELFNEPLNECPGLAVFDRTGQDAMDMWSWAEKGFLPMAGGLDDQMNFDLELINIVGGVRSFYSQTGEG